MKTDWCSNWEGEFIRDPHTRFTVSQCSSSRSREKRLKTAGSDGANRSGFQKKVGELSTPRSTRVVISQTRLGAPQSPLCRHPCSLSSSSRWLCFGSEPLTKIIKSDSERESGLLFWVREPFFKAIFLLSESHFIFGITDMVQWKSLTDRNY